MPIKSAKPYLTVKEAAEFARIAPSTIRLYIRKRQLRAQKVGRRVIIATSELENFLSRNAIAAREG
jgi:excisionase family DNA binding protein